MILQFAVAVYTWKLQHPLVFVTYFSLLSIEMGINYQCSLWYTIINSCMKIVISYLNWLLCFVVLFQAWSRITNISNICVMTVTMYSYGQPVTIAAVYGTRYRLITWWPDTLCRCFYGLSHNQNAGHAIWYRWRVRNECFWQNTVKV